MTATETPSKTYYSTSASLSITINHGRHVMSDGNLTRIDEKSANFSPAGDGYGILKTDDPDLQAWLDKAITNGRSDLLTPEQYFERTTPAEKKVTALQDKLAASERQMMELNKLIADLRAGNKIGSK